MTGTNRGGERPNMEAVQREFGVIEATLKAQTRQFDDMRDRFDDALAEMRAFLERRDREDKEFRRAIEKRVDRLESIKDRGVAFAWGSWKALSIGGGIVGTIIAAILGGAYAVGKAFVAYLDQGRLPHH